MYRTSTRSVLTFVGVMLLSGLMPAVAREPMTPEHVVKVRGVSSAVISPDGRHIAYTLSIPRIPFEDDDGSAWGELHVVDAQGNSRPFITGKVNVGGVDWTPDGKAISFLTKRGDDKHNALYVIPIDGGEARRVLKHEAAISAYSWSPDGQRVAFLAREEEDKETKKLADKGFKAEAYEEDLRDVQLWVGTINDEENEPRLIELEGSVSSVRWSPVGHDIVVAVAPTSLIDDHYMARKLRVVNAVTEEVSQKIDNPGKLGDVAWSPDGKHLAFLSGEDLHDPSPGRLMVADVSTGTFKNILPEHEGHVQAIAWQDNQTVMYIGDIGLFSELAEVGADGTDRKTHVPHGQFVLSGLSLSRDGRSAAMRSSSPSHPAEVFISTHDAPAPRRLTDSNPWLADIELASQEAVEFKARDGLMIQGVLVRPLNEEAGKRYPLILSVHGGPEAHDRMGWATNYGDPGQVGAARGYAVFYPNYRGSTGRGVEFSKMGQGDYGGAEFDDLVDAVDYFIETGLADADRIGITGGSYGGFASAWCATYHTERFAASVMFVGISDHISKAGTTDIPNEMYLVHARKLPWENWDSFRERSPLYYAEQARTPLLIMHGKSDTRVHPSQSMELYRYLKMIGKTPVRLVLYPGEGHGNRKAAARYDYNLRMMRWFDHYLRGAGGDPPEVELEYALKKKDEDDDDESEDEDDDKDDDE